MFFNNKESRRVSAETVQPGSFIYGKYDVHYESKGNGFVTYDPVVNPVREAIGNIVSSIAVGMMTGSVFSSVASSNALISGGAMFGFAY